MFPFLLSLIYRRVPRCAVKTCAVRPVFAWVVGELGAADPSKCPVVFLLRPPSLLGESLRGNTIEATGLRASERKSASERVSERVSEREGFQRFLRGFERFSEVLRGFQSF